MMEGSKEIQARYSKEGFTQIIAELERATDTLQQVSGLFSLLHFLGNGDDQVNAERRFDRLVTTLNNIGDVGASLTEQAFTDAVDAKFALRVLQRARVEGGAQ